MRLEEFKNHITANLHQYWNERVQSIFGDFDFGDNNYLSIIDYVDKIPQKFYSFSSYDFFHKALIEISSQNPKCLVEYFNNEANRLDLAILTLDDINQSNDHDDLFPDSDLELLEFTKRKVNYNYLRLLEGPYFTFIYIKALSSRLQRGKGTEGLDLYNCVEELKNNYSEVTFIYNNTIRNGIAHGNVIFENQQLTYTDKKGNSVSVDVRRMIENFDTLLDLCNGMALATSIFLLTNREFLDEHEIIIPQRVLLKELKYQVDAPGWQVLSTYNSKSVKTDYQLMIYIKNTLRDRTKVLYNSFHTAFATVGLTDRYERVFIHLDSKYGKPTRIGWAAFDAKKMNILRTQGAPLEAYEGVLEDDLLMFVPRIRMPRIVYKVETLFMAMRASFQLISRQKLDRDQVFRVRDASIHSKGRFAAVPDPSVVLSVDNVKDIQEIIRKNASKMIRKSISKARQSCDILSRLRYQPVKYVRVFVYQKDLRKRRLRGSGLIPDLVCTIEYNTSNQIKTYDIYEGTPENFGRYRIVWNKNWKRNEG